MGEGRRPLYKTYSGTAPYGFISYAHADAERVLPVVGALDADRYRLWYDAGIEAGTNWPEVVASHLLHAGAAVFFLSARFLRSQNCVREVHDAVSQRKPMILVYLEPVELPGDLETIGNGAFEGGDFETVIIPDGCTVVESRAFANCRNLRYVYLSGSTELADDAFEGCGDITFLYTD